MDEVEFRNLVGRVGRIRYNLYGNVFFVRIDEKLKAEKYIDLMQKEIPPQSISLEIPENKKSFANVVADFQEMNIILQKANAHVGYRVRDEIAFYMLNNKNAELLNRNEAFDNEIMQKILPRIQGSSAAVKNMLCELFKRCAGEYESYQTESDDISSKMFKAAQKSDCKYRKSAEKIAYMVRRFEEDGFTAYWF